MLVPPAGAISHMTVAVGAADRPGHTTRFFALGSRPLVRLRYSLVPVLRKRFTDAGVAEPDRYSGHSLRRGFATWANAHHWDVKDLMEYVGWKDPASAMRYIERADAFGRQRIEQALAVEPPPAAPVPDTRAPTP